MNDLLFHHKTLGISATYVLHLPWHLLVFQVSLCILISGLSLFLLNRHDIVSVPLLNRLYIVEIAVARLLTYNIAMAHPLFRQVRATQAPTQGTRYIP